MMGQLKNKKIAVLGLGVEGLSNASYARKLGAIVTVLDPRSEEEVSQENREKAKKLGLHVTFNASFGDLSLYDIIIRSQWIKPAIKGFVHAKQKGVMVTSQTQLFMEDCPAKVIGVTGTKGKGTTASLIYEMLKKQGSPVYIGGNIGIAPLDFLDKLTKDDWVVLELSSFQLQDITRSPHIAVLLMITSEHLQAFGSDYQNFHGDLSDYISAKRNILKFQQPGDFAIINRDYLASHESDIHTNGQVFQVSRERDVTTQGCFVKDGKIVLKMRAEVAHDPPAGGWGSPHIKEIIDTKDILLPGKHNLENVCAAVMAATLAGVAVNSIVSVLKTFKGLEHRLELVGTIGGVKYYDDSFSTTPETAMAAIEAFEAPEILILGGSGKNSDFRELGETINKAKNIKAIIGIGTEWQRIKAQFKVQSSKFKVIEGCKNMREIVQAAFDAADPGDVVLLSPACASFDMFKNYKDRGDQFKKEVKQLQ